MAYMDDNIPEGALSAYRDYISDPRGRECAECSGTGEYELALLHYCDECGGVCRELKEKRGKRVGLWEVETLAYCDKCKKESKSTVEYEECTHCGGTGWDDGEWDEHDLD